jgi:hypothetical protein
MKVFIGTRKGIRAYVAAQTQKEAAKQGLDLSSKVAALSNVEMCLALSWPGHIHWQDENGKYMKERKH